MNRLRMEYFGRDLEAMSFARNYHRWILDSYRPFLGRRLVEVGAGAGDFSTLLAEGGPEWLVALEPSGNMFPLLQKRLSGLDVGTAVQGYLSSAIEAFPAAPDTLLYVNVLEHVADDGAELAVAFRTLAPGGHLCLFVPALRFLYSGFDRALGHFRRYRKGELEGLVHDAGFQCAVSRYFDLAGILPWWLTFCLLRRKDLGGKSVQLYDRAVVPILRRFEERWTPPAGKNLLLVAKKPVQR